MKPASGANDAKRKTSTETFFFFSFRQPNERNNSHHVTLARAVDARAVALGDNLDGSTTARSRGAASGSGQGRVAGDDGRHSVRVFFFRLGGKFFSEKSERSLFSLVEKEARPLFCLSLSLFASEHSTPSPSALSLPRGQAHDQIEKRKIKTSLYIENSPTSKEGERGGKLSFFFLHFMPRPAQTRTTRRSCSTSAPWAWDRRGTCGPNGPCISRSAPRSAS